MDRRPARRHHRRCALGSSGDPGGARRHRTPVCRGRTTAPSSGPASTGTLGPRPSTSTSTWPTPAPAISSRCGVGATRCTCSETSDPMPGCSCGWPRANSTWMSPGHGAPRSASPGVVLHRRRRPRLLYLARATSPGRGRPPILRHLQGGLAWVLGDGGLSSRAPTGDAPRRHRRGRARPGGGILEVVRTLGLAVMTEAGAYLRVRRHDVGSEVGEHVDPVVWVLRRFVHWDRSARTWCSIPGTTSTGPSCPRSHVLLLLLLPEL